MELVVGISTHVDTFSNSASNPNHRRDNSSMHVKVGEIQGINILA